MSDRRKRPRDPAQLAKFIVDVATGEIEDRTPTPEEQGKDPAAVALGRTAPVRTGPRAMPWPVPDTPGYSLPRAGLVQW